MLRIEYELLNKDIQYLMSCYSIDSNVLSWTSQIIAQCRYQYSIKIENENSFWFGVQPNWLPVNNTSTICVLRFNPAKCFKSSALKRLLNFLNENNISKKYKQFDCAIDVNIERSRCFLIKDNRMYEEYSRSCSNRTQYLGQRNSHGRVKLYNKAIEQQIKNIDKTRLELTIDIEKSHVNDVKKIFPKVLIFNDLQLDVNMTGTDLVLCLACLDDASRLQFLSRRKKEKIEQMLATSTQFLKFDTVQYSQVLNSICTF